MDEDFYLYALCSPCPDSPPRPDTPPGHVRTYIDGLAVLTAIHQYFIHQKASQCDVSLLQNRSFHVY